MTFKKKFLNSNGDAKATFNIINQLLDKNNDKILPEHTNEIDLANKFSNFYIEKMIRS